MKLWMARIGSNANGTDKAQSTLEYAMIIAVVVTALMAMSIYVQRSVQANLKTVEDQINGR